MERKTTRRVFLATSATIATGMVAVNHLSSQSKSNSNPSLSNLEVMPERTLGNTNIKVPILGLGGAGRTPLSQPNQEGNAINIIEKALQLGITYFDTAASYGPSEDFLGKVLPNYRNSIFLASKTAARDRDGAWRDLEKSLKRLKTDYLDLWQLHHVSFTEELDQITSADGAIQAIEEAKAQKIIKFTGITGHHEPQIITAGLQRYNFDTTLIPINAADAHHPRPFIPSVLPVARQQGVGVIAMKVPAYGRLFRSGVLTGMEQAFGYSLSQTGVSCAIVAAENPQQLESNVQVARNFAQLSSQELAQIEQLTADAWKDFTFFRAWV